VCRQSQPRLLTVSNAMFTSLGTAQRFGYLLDIEPSRREFGWLLEPPDVLQMRCRHICPSFVYDDGVFGTTWGFSIANRSASTRSMKNVRETGRFSGGPCERPLSLVRQKAFSRMSWTDQKMDGKGADAAEWTTNSAGFLKRSAEQLYDLA